MFRPATLALVALAAASLAPSAALAGRCGGQNSSTREGQVILSPREAARARPVQLADGTVVRRPDNQGIPFLFGLGDADGVPSGAPLMAGATPSVEASTPSCGLVPGQAPE
ncbi:hypothetical protein [Mangrovibrevibacter kandeliae]|uniref:hypothetical protein n=1 Tax=Mangrovibrevibacter kandeliae TaxID=2968473 RepID=UPI00211864DF|nr:hypothetical protein [Aurantimonas sp. CSK15Z-1]MCQ8784164.1 hypothetical protein [Aurantimonas sp. CSK15Z-1]MCQ8784275.1 hypothetical protein [Aurantimonas sp. CSK15Z-1]